MATLTGEYSWLENAIDRGVWRATVHGVSKSRTRLSMHTRMSWNKAKGLLRHSTTLTRMFPAWLLPTRFQGPWHLGWDNRSSLGDPRGPGSCLPWPVPLAIPTVATSRCCSDCSVLGCDTSLHLVSETDSHLQTYRLNFTLYFPFRLLNYVMNIGLLFITPLPWFSWMNSLIQLIKMISKKSPKTFISIVSKCALSRVWLFVTTWTVTPPGSSVHGIQQARILERVAISLSRGSSWPRDRTLSPALQADSWPLSHQGCPL